MEKYGETRCYIRNPDGYIIEVGQSEPGSYLVSQGGARPELHDEESKHAAELLGQSL